MEAELQVMAGDELDYAAFAALQKEAYSEIIARLDADDSHFVADFYAWKYRTPLGPARIATISVDSQMVACNAMVPYRICTPLGLISGWQSCDTATLAQARGQGHFPRCVAALQDSIPRDDLFFGFPNAASIKGFLKLGWTIWQDVACWVRPLVIAPWTGRLDPRLMLVNRFHCEQDQFNESLALSGLTFFDRSSDYLNWRYIDHPIFNYECYALVTDQAQVGFVVVREARIKALRFLMIMDFWGASPQDERAILAHCAALANHRGLRHLVTLDTEGSIAAKVANGFLRIPLRVMPKRQLLAGERRGQKKAPLHGLRWRTQFGDWDAF